MKASEAEQSTSQLSVTGSDAPGNVNRSQLAKQMPAGTAAASSSKRQRAVMSRSNWPLPAPPSDSGNVASTTPQPKQRPPRREAVDLSQKEMETLSALQERCKQLGVKIKKTKLLAIALQLLADAPTGKLLAILGPHESTGSVLKSRKSATRGP